MLCANLLNRKVECKKTPIFLAARKLSLGRVLARVSTDMNTQHQRGQFVGISRAHKKGGTIGE